MCPAVLSVVLFPSTRSNPWRVGVEKRTFVIFEVQRRSASSSRGLLRQYGGVNRTVLLSSTVAAALTCADAWCQVRYDLGLELGAAKRFMTDRPSGASQPGFGPAAQVSGHVGVLPMLRAGLYGSLEWSATEGEPARRMVAGGLQLRLVPSLLDSGTYHGWVGLGFGYVGVYAPGFHAQVQSRTPTPSSTDALFDATSGHYFEVPVSIGVARRLRQPWEIFGEVIVRPGFGMSGDYYDGRPGQAPGLPTLVETPPGNESVGLMLMIGVQLDPRG
jgi:hypothetical protein